MKDASLVEKYLEPPFSVLDTTQQRWQDRKRWYKSFGLKSHLGRDDNLLGFSDTILEESGELEGTSIFDPVLCELMYHWYCPDKGRILDPFAGGSVRGVVAAMQGNDYTGIDVNETQVKHNRKQWEEMQPYGDWNGDAEWIIGDSRYVTESLDGEFDFMFTCPPYYDLEQYTDLDDDLSNLPSYDDFASDMQTVVNEAKKKLKQNTFACFVVGEIRGPDGQYRGLVPDTIEWFENAGFRFENEIILRTSLATAAMRARRQFDASRRVVKTHQNVLVFAKGDPKKAVDKMGEVDLTPEDEDVGEFF